MSEWKEAFKAEPFPLVGAVFGSEKPSRRELSLRAAANQPWQPFLWGSDTKAAGLHINSKQCFQVVSLLNGGQCATEFLSA
jgi:hypothetical protein